MTTGAEQQEKYTQSIPRVPPDWELWGFHAAFTYACEARFARLDIKCPVFADPAPGVAAEILANLAD